jgi:RNA-directed DNA polymerase
MHLAFDTWMAKQRPGVPFERYADDVVVHCRSHREAEEIQKAIAQRLGRCKLELHPEKTKIVYCKDSSRRGKYPGIKFDFLGFTFRPRHTRSSKTGKQLSSFLPAVSDKAQKEMRRRMRRDWKLIRRSGSNLQELAAQYNPVLRGWIAYYGRFYKSELVKVFQPLNRGLVRWARRKYKRLKTRRRGAREWMSLLTAKQPNLWVHWRILRIMSC